MKIGPPTAGIQSEPATTTPGATAAASARAAGGDAAVAPAARSGDSAQVELSSTAATLLAGGASADFDADKVQRISQAIADGSFKVNAEAIADRLIANAEEVLRSHRPGPAGG